jgi:hypothetical protein
MVDKKSKLILIIRKKWLVIALFSVILAVAPFLVASSHKTKLYVNNDANGTQDGSVSHPFKTIGKAMDKADSKTEIHVSNGTYKENIALKKGVALYGESEDGVVIKAKDGNNSTIIMSDDSKINKVTVKGGATGIKVKNDAKASIIKVTIKDNDRDGIYVEEGDVTDKKMVSISECNIKNNGWGGIYSHKRRLSIVENEIRSNGSEGVDLEAGTSAWISDNNINENDGTGMKIRIDGSSIWTRNNAFRSNKKEGMEISFAGGAGRINIEKAKIVGNHKYGIARIQRAQQMANNTGLWNKYLTYGEKNYFFENRLGDISPVIFK